MLRSMYSGVTGLKGFQLSMDVVGNNIANVNTIGYKASRVTFQSTFYQTLSSSRAPQNNRGGINAMQVGLGTRVASIDKIMNQGSFQNTGKKTDLAIQGDGFFILSDGVSRYYTRSGNFALDSSGFLVNPSTGFKLQGWSSKLSETGKRYVDTNEPIGDIQIQAGLVMAAKQTTAIKLAHNINADVGIKETNIVITTNANDQVPIRFTFERDMSLEYRNRNVYRWKAEVMGTDYYEIDPGSASGIVEVDDFGNVIRWNFDPAHEIRNSSGARLDIGNASSEWTVRAVGKPTLLVSGSPASFTALKMYRDSANPDNVILVVDEDGDFTTTGDQHTFTISTDGTIAGLNKELKAGVTSGSETFKGLEFVAGENTSFSDIPLSDTEAWQITISTTSNDVVKLYDIRGNMTPLLSEQQMTIGAGGDYVSFAGSLNLTGPDGEVVYYDPRRIIFNFDSTTATGTITLYLKDGTSISFTIPNDYDGDSSTLTREDFNTAMSEGITNDFGYRISGLRITNGNSTDELDTGGNDYTYLSVLNAVQPPIQGSRKFYETDNPSNFTIADYENPSVTTSVLVYDSLGNPTNVYIKFTKIAENTWFWKAETSDGRPLYALMSDGSTSDNLAEGVIAFDSNGNIAATDWTLDDAGNIIYNANVGNPYPVGFWYDPAKVGSALDTSVYPSSTAAAGPVKVEINFGEVTQFVAPSSVAVIEQNGHAEGTLESFAINEQGEIIGTFSNGLTDILGQIALAVFNNSAGLRDIGNSLYAQSANSGLPQIGEAGVGGRGTLIPGALEMSNVDLAEEFTKMIVAQRGFQAVARVITTSDDILRELVGIKR